MTLSTKQRKALKAKAHHLKPVIQVGQKGITENLIQETVQALEIHALIKVHIAGEDREARKLASQELASRTDAELVHRIGKTCILYREKTADS